MGSFSLLWFTFTLTISTTLRSQISNVEATWVGVNYGLLGDNLPSPNDVVALFKKSGIGSIRLFEPKPEILQALKGTEITVSLGIRNNDVQLIASSQDGANTWFATNVEPYINDITFEFISIGNEIIPGAIAGFVAPAMRNLQKILDAHNLGGISVTTVIATSALGVSFPPSSGAFSNEAIGPMTDILIFLSKQSNPLLVNVYPYFAYASDPVNVRQDYALFTSSGPVVQDAGLGYQNLFDAIVDAVYSAIEKSGHGDVSVAISETGWPSGGNGNLTTPELAAIYNKNFAQHIGKGTPKRPNVGIEGYIFSMFNENLKPAGIEQNWGLFYPNMQPVYPFF